MLDLSAPNSPGRTCARYGRSRIPGSSICYLLVKPKKGAKDNKIPTAAPVGNCLREDIYEIIIEWQIALECI